MAMSNAERQRKFRAEMKKKRRYRKEIWTDAMGFIAAPGTHITLKELEKELGNILKDYDDTLKETIYAEIVEHTKLIEKRFRPVLRLVKANETLPDNA